MLTCWILLVSLLTPTWGSTPLNAQDQVLTRTPNIFDRESLFRKAAYRWAYDQSVQGTHSWSSSEHLLRARSAMYAELGHMAQRELEFLARNGSNSGYQVSALLQTGLIQFNRGEYGEARLTLDGAIAKCEGKERASLRHVAGEAYFWIGTSHLVESGQAAHQPAVGALQSCAELYPDNPRADDALYFLGQLAESDNDYESALVIYNDLLSRYPTSEYRMAAAIRRTQLLALLKRYDEALDELDEAEDMWSWFEAQSGEAHQNYTEETELELLLLRGEIKVGQGDLAGAERSFQTLLYGLEGSYRREGMLGLAETYRVSGHYDSAVSLYNRIIASDSVDAIAERAVFYRSLAHLDNPESDSPMRDAAYGSLYSIAKNSDHPMRDRAALAISHRAYRDGSWNDAIGQARWVIDSSSNGRLRAEAAFIRACALEAIERYSEAADGYSDAAKRALSVASLDMPRQSALIAAAEHRRGYALYRATRFEEAIQSLERFAESYPDAEETPRAIRLAGEAAFEAGMYDYAITTLERLIDAYPGSEIVDDALYTIGWAHFRKNDMNSAENAFSRLVKAYPLSEYAAESQLRRADCFYLNRQFDRAAESYAAVTALTPSASELQYAEYQRSMATWQAGDTSSARRMFALYVASHDESQWADDAMFMTGLLDYRSGDYSGSIRIMRRLLETFSDSRLHARAYYTIGDSYYRMRQFDEALAAYSIVTERFPKSSYITDAETGIVYARAAREKRSDREHMGAVQVADIGGRPSYELELRRAQIFLDANRISDAEREFQSFVNNYAESANLPVGWLGLAECALARHDTMAAIDTLASMLDRFSDGHALPPAALRLSDLHVSQGDTIEAIKVLRRIRTDFPQSAAVATARLREADLRLSVGDRERAKGILRTGAAELDSLNGWKTRTGGAVLSKLARLEAEDGEIAKARLRWQLLAQREDSLGTHALISLADACMQQRDYTAAIRSLERAVKRLEPGTDRRVQLELDLGRACERESNVNRAREIYESIIDQRGDDEYGREAKHRLESLKEL